MSIAPAEPDYINAPTGQTAAYYQALITKAWGASYGQAYATYNSQNPATTPYQNAIGYIDKVIATGLKKAFTAVGTGTGAATGQVVTGAAQGADQFAQSFSNPLDFLSEIGDFFHRLTEASTWERIAEVLLGAVLLAVGIARLTHAVPAATAIAKTAGAAAL